MDAEPVRGKTGATIVHVAERAGVSVRTVSRVLNDSPKVNARTRQHVAEVMASLRFRPSARARGLATGRSYLLGLIHNDRNAHVLDLVQRGIVEVSGARGYELVVHPTPLDGADAAGDIADFVHRSRVDGLIVLAPVSGVAGLAQALRPLDIPMIAISSVPLDGFTCTFVTDERGGAARAAALLRRLGHRHVGIVNGPADAHSAQERRRGFIDAFDAADLPEAPGDYGFDSGLRAAESLLSRIPRPTAIFAANDIMAAAVLRVARSRGIDVPRDLSVVGFDASIFADMTTPALTTVCRPMAEIAQDAARHLLSAIDGQDVATPPVADLALVEAGSTGPAPQSMR